MKKESIRFILGVILPIIIAVSASIILNSRHQKEVKSLSEALDNEIALNLRYRGLLSQSFLLQPIDDSIEIFTPGSDTVIMMSLDSNFYKTFRVFLDSSLIKYDNNDEDNDD